VIAGQAVAGAFWPPNCACSGIAQTRLAPHHAVVGAFVMVCRGGAPPCLTAPPRHRPSDDGGRPPPDAAIADSNVGTAAFNLLTGPADMVAVFSCCVHRAMP